MACLDSKIPKYLHFTEKKRPVLSQSKFKINHILFRTGFKEKVNPIELPPSNPTSISVCWNKLIQLSHVLFTVKSGAKNPDNLGNHVFYGFVGEVNRFNLKRTCESGIYMGLHTITLSIRHDPLPCNYSHAEILINHTYHENNELKSVIIEHSEWKNSLFKTVKGENKKFFKDLELNFRADVVHLLKRDSDVLNKTWFSRSYIKVLIIRLFLPVQMYLVSLKKV
ncbi:MAG: hypothetical protein L6Q66_08995 [Bacteroidia bacterium]|uniref:hypothetical protein n=1 Tax=Flavobacterium sp. TaxID=239 RepID=UPI0025C1C4AD|nr:hypothetical protein [Flavobacterium sp.]MCK6609243.1 hypothetical protein [Flavobacterium sp.]MCK6649779.1 hypothetical protein [Bacteroidia bacterium]